MATATKKNICTAAAASAGEAVTGVFVQTGGGLRQASLAVLQQALEAAQAAAEAEEGEDA